MQQREVTNLVSRSSSSSPTISIACSSSTSIHTKFITSAVLRGGIRFSIKRWRLSSDLEGEEVACESEHCALAHKTDTVWVPPFLEWELLSVLALGLVWVCQSLCVSSHQGYSWWSSSAVWNETHWESSWTPCTYQAHYQTSKTPLQTTPHQSTQDVITFLVSGWSECQLVEIIIMIKLNETILNEIVVQRWSMLRDMLSELIMDLRFLSLNIKMRAASSTRTRVFFPSPFFFSLAVAPQSTIHILE